MVLHLLSDVLCRNCTVKRCKKHLHAFANRMRPKTQSRKVDLIPTEAKSFQYAHCKMLPTSFLQSSFFEGLGKYLSRKGLQVCGASCRQAMELAYNSSAWRSVDFSQWSPLGGHTEPGDIDLMLALKRLRHGSLRCVLLESSRISHHAFKELLTIQSQIEKLVIRSPPASARAFASAHQLKHLELLGPSTLLCAEAKRLETLVLHLPSLSDLQVSWILLGLCK